MPTCLLQGNKMLKINPKVLRFCLFVFLNQNSVQIKACDWTVSGRAAKAPSSSAYHLTVINI